METHTAFIRFDISAIVVPSTTTFTERKMHGEQHDTYNGD